MPVATIDPALGSWLEEALAHPGEPLAQGYQARVHQFASPSGELVVKIPHAGALSGWLARRTIRREYRVYTQLRQVAGIPHCFGLTAAGQLVLAKIPGASLRQRRPGDMNRFYSRLLETILAMHAAGVAHGDLKRKENIIVGPEETPFLIDFGIAAVVDERSGALARRWFELVRQMDLNAWVKLKHGRQPDNLPPADRAHYRPLWTERIARSIRIPWQTLTLRRARQRWRRKK